MELRLYWQIIRRRLVVGAGPVGPLSGLAYLSVSATGTPVYQASMRFVVGIAPEPSTGEYYTYDRYYTWLTAEYLVDDLSEVVKSQAFARDVAAASGLDIPAGAIQGATSAGKLHRILNVSIQWANAAELERIANAVAQVLSEPVTDLFRATGHRECGGRLDRPSADRHGGTVAQAATRPALAAHCSPYSRVSGYVFCWTTWTTPSATAPTWRRLACAFWEKFRDADLASTAVASALAALQRLIFQLA